MSCSHDTFHVSCLEAWAAFNPTCPICRAPFSKFFVIRGKTEVLRDIPARHQGWLRPCRAL